MSFTFDLNRGPKWQSPPEFDFDEDTEGEETLPRRDSSPSLVVEVPNTEIQSNIYQTKKGYCEGVITGYHDDFFQVVVIRNEEGDTVEEKANFLLSDQVIPFRKTTEIRLIFDKSMTKGFIRPQEPLPSLGIGSGIIGSLKGSKGHLLETPLSIHNQLHLNTFLRVSQGLKELLNIYLEKNVLSEILFDKICWLLNIVLYIDGFEIIPPEVILEALTNFFLDYKSFPRTSFIRQPINYILDIYDIDGLCIYEDEQLQTSIRYTFYRL